jgi:hypothetical protein
MAQCIPKGITTNPDNSDWSSSVYDQPYKKNTGANLFDWRTNGISVNIPNIPAYNNTLLTSPFFFGTNASHLNGIIAFPDNNGAKNDFNPKDGWELIQRDFGYKSDHSVETPAYLAAPYFILYNKYTGTLRVLGYLSSSNGDFPIVNVKLSMKDAQGNGNVTGLLNYYNKVALPLDQSTPIWYATTPAALPFATNQAFFADFKIAYDPCTCNSNSKIVVSFEKVQDMDVELYGRLIATSTPIDQFDATHSSIDFSQYLTSVYNNPTDYQVSAGILTYKDIQTFKDDYNKLADDSVLPSFLKEGLDILSKAFSLGEVFAPEPLKKGLEAGSILSDFLSGRFGSESTSLPAVIKGEVSLKGHVINKSEQWGAGTTLANPGSAGSENAPADCCSTQPYYPLYNEVLGVFNLLYTPQVSAKEFSWGFGGVVTHSYEYHLSSPLQYTFNPAVKVNLANSHIYGSFEINEDPSTEGKNVFKRYTTNNISKFTSPLVPIESLSSFSVGYSGPSAGLENLTLSLTLDLEFQDLNKNGTPNKALYVITYPVTRSSLTNAIGIDPGYSEYITIGSTNYTSSTISAAWKDITITGNLTATAGTTININAGGNVILVAGSSVGPGISLQGGVYPITVNTSVIPQSSASVTSFCNSATYKANSVAETKKVNNPASSNLFAQEKLHETIAYPNPAQNIVNFQYYVEEASYVRLSILDLTGREITTVVDEFQEAGEYDLSVETTGLTNGVYVYTLETSQGKESKRLLIMK